MNSLLTTRLAPASSILALTVLAGCGGDGGGGSTTWVAPAAGYYQPLDSTSATSNDFGGVGTQTNDANSTIAVTTASGTITHDTGALNYNDGAYNLVDPDGFSGNLATDGAGGTLSKTTGQYAGTYQYVMPVTFSYTVSGVAYTTQGFAGISTEAAHVPVSGAATYNGEATGTIAATSGFYELAGGISAISVDFGAGTAGVTLNGFSATDAAGAPATASLDTVQITGMTIAGNTFTGGTLATLLSGVPVDITGTNTTVNSQGMFFGWDSATDIPDEVGGVSVAVGDDGILLFSFVAN